MARRHLAPPEAQILTMPKSWPDDTGTTTAASDSEITGVQSSAVWVFLSARGCEPRSRLSRVVCRAGDCQVDQLGKRPRADLLHRGRTMGLDGPLADAKDVGDLLVWIAFDDHPHDLALARG